MGLCKCPKKKVTNQFCFEHRVNVCEYCIVDEHSKCVVQSYLRWLDGSDYSPVCQLCQEDLVSDECVRLVCYDIFHRSCLDEFAKNLPSNTPASGYGCPVCTTSIFPASNMVSPVASALRDVLSSYEWANIGLEKALETSSSSTQEHKTVPPSPQKLAETHYSNTSASASLARGIPDGHEPTPSMTVSSEAYSSSSQHRSLSNAGKKNSNGDSTVYISTSYDTDEEEDTGDNKYKRRSAIEWFTRWIRTLQRPSSRRHHSVVGWRGRRMCAIITLLVVASVIVIVSYAHRSAADEDDPMLDPFNNPNIRVEQDNM